MTRDKQQATIGKDFMERGVGYKKLKVYQRAHALVLCAYQATRSFPKDELFGLVSQMRRCAVSVPANIVEGYGRRTDKDKLQFLYIARGSLNELEYFIDLALELSYIDSVKHEELAALREETARLLFGFIRVLEK